MSVTQYTPSSPKIFHEARVDFRQRVIQSMIHIVQYDKSLPIIAVELYSNGQKWELPSEADVKVRWGKRDHTYVYLNVLGCNADRTIVYFEIVEQMTVFYGEHNPVLEVIIGQSVACSSYIPFYIDRNPIQRGDIESQVVPSVIDVIEQLETEVEAKQDILVSGTNIKTINGQSILGSGDLVVSGGFDPSTIPSGTIAVDSIVGLNSLGALVKGNLDGKYVKIIAAPASVSSQLTEEQIDGTKGGVYTTGSMSGYTNPVFFPRGNEADGVSFLPYSSGVQVARYHVSATGLLAINAIYLTFLANGQLFLGDNVAFNGKTIPQFPTNNSEIRVLSVGKNGGNCSWVNFVNNFAPEYDATQPYALGALCTHEGTLYQCSTAIATAESWNAAHWTRVYVSGQLSGKQDTLVSGTNIKTINNQSLLGSGNITISADLSNYYTKTETDTLLNAKQATLVSGTNIKTINNTSILGSGNITIDKSSIGLGNVNNTSDANKPISTATQTALNNKQDKLVEGSLPGNYLEYLLGFDGQGELTQSNMTSGTPEDILGFDSQGINIVRGKPLKLGYLTTAPSANNTSGCITIVVLSSDPATKYDGYLYIITGSNA